MRTTGAVGVATEATTRVATVETMEAATGVAMAVATGVADITGRTSRAGGARLDSERGGGLGQLLLRRLPLRVERLQLAPCPSRCASISGLALREVVVERRIRELRLALLLLRLQRRRSRASSCGDLLLDGALHRAAPLAGLGLQPLALLLRQPPPLRAFAAGAARRSRRAASAASRRCSWWYR